MKRYLSSFLLGAEFVLFVGCHGGKEPGKPGSQDSKQAGSSETASKGSGGGQKESSVPSDTVQIKREDQSRAGIRIAMVTVSTVSRTLNVTAQVGVDEKHTEHVGVLADGRIENVVVLPGDMVRRGQTLATLHSHVVHETVAALTQAFAALARQKSAVTFATQARDRYSKLFAIQAASLEEKQRAEQALAQAQKDLIDAESSVHAEREHLAELLQVRPESLQPGTLYDRELIPVRAVADGVVISRSITPGQVVNTGDEAFLISNLSTVWVNAAVNEKDLAGVHIGARATVLTQGTVGQGLSGTVAMIGNVLDPQTRTLPVRITVPNPGTRLRPGMFANALIDEASGRLAIFVPSTALQDVNGFRVVFTTPDGVTFQAHAVKTGAETNGMTEVIEGLRPTDHVVVDGAFMVKSELLKGTVGED